jgi:hypothetical protein
VVTDNVLTVKWNGPGSSEASQYVHHAAQHTACRLAKNVTVAWLSLVAYHRLNATRSVHQIQSSSTNALGRYRILRMELTCQTSVYVSGGFEDVIC